MFINLNNNNLEFYYKDNNIILIKDVINNIKYKVLSIINDIAICNII